MSYCVNPNCPEPHNPDAVQQCRACGSGLLLQNRYRVLRRLGHRTFLAVDVQEAGQHVIQQWCLPALVSKANTFQRAAQLAALGKHPQIPALVDSFEQEDCFYLVEEWIAGETLAESVNQRGAFTEVQIWQLLAELLPALKWLHDQGVIHGDIKPANLIAQQPLVLVGGGIALIATDNATDNKIQFNTGSPEYMAPEQVQGKAVFASDLYSLGVTCLYLLTQVPPFDLFDLMGQDIWQFYLLEDLSPALSQILSKLTQAALNQRFQSADEALQAMKQAGVNVSVSRTVSPSPCILQPTSLLRGHSASVNAVAFSPDAQQLASASDDKTVRLWNLETEQPILTLAGHSGCVKSVAFSPDGALLASASDDKTIKLWNWQTGQQQTLSGHTAAVKSLCFSPNFLLASGSWDKTVKIWQIETESVSTLTGHSLQVTAVAFSPDGQTLASASFDRTARLWRRHPKTGSFQLDYLLTGHTWAVSAVAFSPDGKLLATGSHDNTIKLWHVKTGELLQTLAGHSWSVGSVVFSPDGKTLISASWDKTIKLWQVSTGAELTTLIGHTNSVHSIAMGCSHLNHLSQPSQLEASDLTSCMIASGGQDTLIQLWQFKTVANDRRHV